MSTVKVGTWVHSYFRYSPKEQWELEKPDPKLITDIGESVHYKSFERGVNGGSFMLSGEGTWERNLIPLTWFERLKRRLGRGNTGSRSTQSNMA